MNSSGPYRLHWFRRDLRVEGNRILQNSIHTSQGRVVGVFCFDRKFLSRPDFSHSRFLFFLRTLEQLKKQIEALGGDLIILDGGPKESFPRFLSELSGTVGLPTKITWNRDYEPFALQRDQELETLFQAQFGIEVETARDHLMIEPNELLKNDATSGSPFYQVFTPFKKKWLQIFESAEVKGRLIESAEGLNTQPRALARVLIDSKIREQSTRCLEEFLRDTALKVKIPIPAVGFQKALAQAHFFTQKKLVQYPTQRDLPAEKGTSQLSIYLKNGSFTVPQLLALLVRQPPSEAREKWMSQLIWREFYFHILAHFPYVETGCFHRKYDAIRWENREDWFERWKEGNTGFPIVDAGMRQLLNTGWMHNRVRMIVASFLTKDLLIDWRWGERYFMETLLDGDLAENNGGWQWAASTGCDPQPYFRIFNPALQQERFDPDLTYIRRWTEGQNKIVPLVDHAQQKVKALQLFKSIA